MKVVSRVPRETSGRFKQRGPFWSHVSPGEGGCWLWTGSVQSSGYGSWGGQGKLAHRLAYEDLVGPVPHGLVLDHLCHVRLCVNPDHLNPVTIAVNNRNRKGRLS